MHDESEVPRITVEELHELLTGDQRPVVLDVRSRSSHDRDGAQIPHSVRVQPDSVVEWADGTPTAELIVTYCT